jgi:hypothetical protein
VNAGLQPGVAAPVLPPGFLPTPGGPLPGGVVPVPGSPLPPVNGIKGKEPPPEKLSAPLEKRQCPDKSPGNTPVGVPGG